MADEHWGLLLTLNRFCDSANIIIRSEARNGYHTLSRGQAVRKDRGCLLGTSLATVPNLIYFDPGTNCPRCHAPDRVRATLSQRPRGVLGFRLCLAVLH